MFVIFKLSRSPTKESYSGITWDRANLRERYKAQYETREEAELLASALNYENPIGFAVEEI